MFESWLTQKNAFIFRITAIQNLSHILEHGIPCRNCQPQNPNFVNIGGSDIIEKRDSRVVPLAPYGSLSDYVPFYFAPRSPMLGSIFYHETFPQNDIIHIVSKASIVQEANIPFVFTNGHALMDFSIFRNSLDDLHIIDWEVMRSKYWRVTEADNDRMRRRMAEFLIHQHFPARLITSIGVKSEEIAVAVKTILDRFALHVKVNVLPDWYY